MRTNVAFVALFFFLMLTFLLLAAGAHSYFIYLVSYTDDSPSIGQLTGKVNVAKAGGGLGIVTAFIAYYIGLSELLAAGKVFNLPVGAIPSKQD